MRDNKDHIDSKFIHESWKNLRSTLDTELPLTNTPRNSYVYVLSAILFISLSALGYLIHLQLTDIPVTNTTKEVIKYEKVFVPYYIDAPSAEATTKSKKDRSSQFVNSTPINTQLEQEKIKIPSVFPTSRSQTNALELASNEGIETSELQELESNHMELFDASYTLSSPELSTLGVQRKLGLMNLYFSFGGFISNLDYTGYSIESGIQLPLSRVLSIQTGVSLSFISRDYFILPFIETAGGENFKASSTPDLDDADTYYAGLQGFNQVVIPLGLSYKVNNRFNISTGVKLRYTYSESIDRVLQTKAQQKISKNQSVANTFFNNTNLGIFIGVSYELSDHVSLTFDTEWGLYSVISNKHLNDPGYRKYDLNLITVGSSFKF